MRHFHDQIEAHYRGLEALGVDRQSYSSIVVPLLMAKLPDSVRMNMIRFGDNHLDWTLDEFVSSLSREVEIRESYTPIFKPGLQDKTEKTARPNKQDGGLPSAAALFTAGNSKNIVECAFCKKEHKSEDCETVKDPEERKKILLKSAKCFMCFKPGHRAFKCRSKTSCSICNGKHNSILCSNVSQTQDKATPAKPSAPPLNPNASSWLVGSIGSASQERVALQTALANVEGKKEVKMRVMFDTGSQKTFITAKAVNKSGAKPVRKESLGIKAFGRSEPEVVMRDVFELPLVSLNGGKSITVEAFLVNEISTIANEHVEVVKKQFPHLSDIFFSDVSRLEDTLEIDILIGANYVWLFQDGCSIRGGPHEPIAIQTTLGWVLSGPLPGEKSSSIVTCNHVVHVIEPMPFNRQEKQDLEKSLHKLWDLDTLGIRAEDEVHEGTIDNISFTGERYSVQLSWKVGHSPVPTNYNSSLIRLKSQFKKLSKPPDVLEKYDKIISEQLETGVIEEVLEPEMGENISYLPHQAVIREDVETTKVRVVYDASCKDKKTSVSLNDCLHVGPPLTPLIFDMLLRFREGRVALVGDIEKAFLNIEVDPKDCDCLRFLWFKDIHADNPEIVTYKFLRVPFGLKSSPFLLNAVLRYHIDQYKEIDPEFVNKLSQGFFVDDLVTSCSDTEEAYSLYNKASDRMQEGGFKLRKWKTNDELLAQKIVENDSKADAERTYSKEALGISKDMGGKTKVLGIGWDTNRDTLEFDLSKVGDEIPRTSHTKREILSTLATLFDPQGLVSPVAVTAKALFQELCIEKLGWDDHIPQDKATRWEEWLRDLKTVRTISVPRSIFEGITGEVLSTTLHGFGDASKKAYCASIFLVCQTTEGVYTRLLCAKTRVAPLKSLTINRLELMSAKILVTLMETVVNALSSQTKIDEVKYWLDSKTALYWIYNNGEWKNFVQHRVNEILKRTRKEDWGHVAGVDNPADLGSRGVTASHLRDSKIWWEGPEWLKKGRENWPNSFPLEISDDVREESKKTAAAMIMTKEKSGVHSVIEIERYSSLRKLLRVTAYVKRFIENMKRKRVGVEMKVGRIEVDEIRQAEMIWIKNVQEALVDSPICRKVSEQLGIVSQDGILVCKGRLENSDLGISGKFPIILPRDNKFTEMIILDCHEKVYHCKVRGTLAEVRSRFWITRGRQYVKKVLKHCFICRKLEGKPYNAPPTAALPDFRVNQAPPFSNVGVDFAGPLYVKASKGNMVKSYIALFTCCVTRAVHLELVPDLFASTFVNCLRRFCSRRGTPSLIVSDNAKTFKATSKLLKKLFRTKQVEDFLESRRINWRFNLERAPWMGGMFERMVGSMKRCLRKVLGNAKLNFDELSTVLTEIEGTLNSRPLTYQYDLEESLTPSHLMFGHRLTPLSFDVETPVDVDSSDKLCKRFLYLSRKLTHFWNRWRREYLTNLREQHKLKNFAPNKVAEGDVIQVHDENTKRGQWKIGIVEKLIFGKDGQVRGASVRLVGKGKLQTLTRPLQKLYPLEITGSDAKKEENVENLAKKDEVRIESSEKGEKMSLENLRGGKTRSKRAAAKDSRWKSKLMLDP